MPYIPTQGKSRLHAQHPLNAPPPVPTAQTPSRSAAPPPLPDGVARARTEVRRAMRARREDQPPELATARSLEAQRRLMDSPLWHGARSVALYVGVRGELGTRELLRAAWREGRKVWLPRVRRDEPGLMDFAACSGPEWLRPGPHGLLEPDAALPGFGPGGGSAMPPSARDAAGDGDDGFAPDLALLPGVAFDLKGGRLGYGGGYYDRFLEHGLTCPLVGLCFEFQLVESLPLAPWDRRVNHICTEERLLCL